MYNTLIRKAAKGNMPYDAEIEYLESTGTQWIDTGFKHDNNTRFSAKMSFVYINTWRYPFGSFGNVKGSNSIFALEIDGSLYITSYYGPLKPGKFAKSSSGTIYTIDLNKNIHTVNNITVTHPECAFSSIYNDYVFACTDYNGLITGKGSYRFYYFKIYDNDVLVRDFIPVRVGQVGYMYDKVSGQLFGNAGTGNFILGPDVN